MASTEYPCWAPDNPREQTIVNKCDALKKLLNKNMEDLADNIRMDALWPTLIALDVLDRKTESMLRQGTNYEQVQKIMSWLLKNPRWKLNAFLRALCRDNQKHILSEILKLNPEEFNQKKITGSKPIEPGQGNSQPTGMHTTNLLPEKLKEAIKVQSDYYARSMMTGHLFDLKELGIPYDINDCYIRITASEDRYLGHRKDIPPEKILVVEPGNPKLRTVLVSGSTGSGKSTTVRSIAYKWSKQKEEERDWDLVILLNLSTVKLTPGASTQKNMKAAIQQSLVGKEEKDEIMDNLDNKKFRVLIIADNLDECRNEETSNMVKEMVEEAHKGSTNYSMLVACRSGLCSIKEHNFDRRIKVDGFTLDDGLQYVKNFYSKCRNPPDSTLMEYIADNKDNLDHILTNPMFTHIYSVVTSNGTITPTKGQILSKTDILQALVTTLTERQLEKNKNTRSNSQVELSDIDLESQVLRFFKLCLFALLKDIRPIKEDLLDLFGIDRRNPLLSFLEVKNSFNEKYERTVEWHFTHTVFLEYFATCALEKLPDNISEHFVFLLCCNQTFRNVQRILFCSLGKKPEQVQRLSKMVQATLFLQSTLGRHSSLSKSDIDGLMQLHQIQDALKSVMNINNACEILLPKAENSEMLVMPQLSDDVKNLWEEISSLYGKNSEDSQDSGLFFIMSRDHEVMKHVYECLHEVPEELQKLLFDNSITCLLPSKYNKGETSQTIYPTGDTRWTEIQEDDGGIYIYTSCLSDACQAIAQHNKSHTGLTELESSKSSPPWDATNKKHRVMTLAFRPELTHLFYPASQLATGKWKVLGQFVSLQAWSELLCKLLQLGLMVDQLNIHWDRTHNVSAISLLNCLLLEETQHVLRKLVIDHDGWLDILLQFSQIDAKDLSEWRTLYLRQNIVRIQLLKLRCDNQHPQPLQGNLEEQLHSTVHGGFLLFSGLMMSNPGGSVTWFRRLGTGGTRATRVPDSRNMTASNKAGPQHLLKVMAIGDAGCGKTCLITRFTDGCFIPSYGSTAGLNYAKTKTKDCAVQLWDTSGQKRFRSFVGSCLRGTDIVLVCYDVNIPSTLRNIGPYWYPEVRQNTPHLPPVVVVGCKTDLRSHCRDIKEYGVPVTTNDGQQMADMVSAHGHFECSALTGEGIQELFEAITRFGVSEQILQPDRVPSRGFVLSAGGNEQQVADTGGCKPC